MRPKTQAAYLRGVRHLGKYFDHDVTDLSASQLVDYFDTLLKARSWSTVKHHVYGLKFYYQHVLDKPWAHIDLVQPPTQKRLPDIVSVEEVAMLFNATHILSYKVFFFTLYSLGLRLGEGLALTVADVDGPGRRVHVRNAKGNKDRFVPLPEITLHVLRRFWARHRHPTLLFPNRKRGLAGCHAEKTPLDRGGVQQALRAVCESCGVKKRLPLIHCAIVMPRI